MRSNLLLSFVFSLASLICILMIGYDIERYETLPLFAAYFPLFIAYWYIIKRLPALSVTQFRFWIGAAIVFRVALLFSIPSLSDDFYRFIWDGRLLAAGLSPFTQVPSYYMEASNAVPGLTAELFENLNSQHRFSSYPPVCQLVFWLAAQTTDSIFGTVLIMKAILLSFELLTFLIMTRSLELLQIPKNRLLVYALNPLVIIEIMGNVHFEGIMIFFLLLATYLLIGRKIVASTGAFALSVGTKLIPLLFLPLLVRLLGWTTSFRYWILTALFVLILFVPLVERDLIAGFSTSLGYYFQYFEFNASVYYLIRELGFWIFGFNIIQYAGPFLALVAAVLIFRISLKDAHQPSFRKNYERFFNGMVWCLFIYFVSTTILHPWYIITLLALSLFTSYRFPLLWTGLIFLTYAGYNENSYQENTLLVTLEYFALFWYILYETIWQHRKSHS